MESDADRGALSMPLVDPDVEQSTEVLERPASYEPPTLRDQLLARPVARRVLLFAGIVRPQRGLDACAWWLPWILCRVGIAATMLFYLFLLVVDLFLLVDPRDTWWWSIVSCAVIALQQFATLSCFWWLPRKLDQLPMVFSDGEESARLARAERVAVGFLASVVVLPFVPIAVIDTKLGDGHTLLLSLSFQIPSAVVLAALLLVVACETDAATTAIRQIHAAARSKTLDRVQYIETRDAIARRDTQWSVHLGALAFVALLNTATFVCSVYRLGDGLGDTLLLSTRALVGAELAMGVCFLKEPGLLLILLYFTAVANDHADALPAILVTNAPWGEPFSADEMRRLDVLSLATQYSLHPDALKSNYSFLTTPYVQPITSSLMGVRATRTLFLTSAASLVVSLASSAFKYLA